MTMTEEEVINTLDQEFVMMIIVTGARCSCGTIRNFNPIWLSVLDTLAISCVDCGARHELKLVKV